MKTALTVPKKIALALIAAFVLILGIAWLALPGIVQSQAEKLVATKSGHRLSMAPPQFDLFALSLRLSDLKLEDPAGEPLLAVDRLLVDLSAASLASRAAVFDAIRIDGLAATLIELPGGRLNWSPFIEAWQDKDEKSSGLPRLEIRAFALTGGRIDVADRRLSPGFAARIEPLELSLTDLSTLPADGGSFKIEARTSIGLRFALAGTADLDPLAVSGTLDVTGLKLAELAPYLSSVLAAPPAGEFELAARYRAGIADGRLDAVVDNIEARLSGLRLPLAADGATFALGTLAVKDGSVDLARHSASVGAIVLADARLDLPRIEPAPALASARIENATLDWIERRVSLGRIALEEGRLSLVRSAAGQIALVDALRALAAGRRGGETAAPAPVEAPWRFRLDAVGLSGFALALRDEGSTPPTEIALNGLSLETSGVSDDLTQALPVKAAFQLASGGRFEANGRATPGGPAGVSADLKLRLAELALKPAQAYLGSRLRLDIASGSLSTQGRLAYDVQGPSYRGDFSVRDLRLNESGTDNAILSWKRFGTRELSATAQRLDIGELRLDGLDTQLIIAKDKSLNLQRILKPAPAAGETAPPAGKADPGFVVNVARLRLADSEMDFADHSLVLPFGTRIHKLRGTVDHLSSRPGGPPGQLELEGDVDEYGLARAAGQVDLFDPTGFMDLRVLFKNVEMNRLTPYMATFAGRRIDSGKLSLDLQYKLKQRQLQGDNQVVIDRLTLGERVESPSAKDLPLDLALAILQDSDGRIDLGLPISGSLDDPEFSYGSIVWKAITNVLTKIVTAPFRALASLFGGGEKLENVVFEAGAAQLTPPEREKLARMATGLAKRPKLMLAVGGAYAEGDRIALQDVQLRRAVQTRLGQRGANDADPGPVSTAQPAVREALEKLYGERFGAADLAALKDGFRQANPGQLEESVAGKMMSRLSGLLRDKKRLSDEEIGSLKGADFHALLYERLRAKEPLDEARLKALAQARAESAAAQLQAAGLGPERLRTLAPEKAEDGEGGIALRLALETAK